MKTQISPFLSIAADTGLPHTMYFIYCSVLLSSSLLEFRLKGYRLCRGGSAEVTGSKPLYWSLVGIPIAMYYTIVLDRSRKCFCI